MTYREALSYLRSLETFGMRLGLQRIRRLAALLGMPQEAYRTVHITGTNGKGSASALTAAALTASGLRTGLYTSPHLVSYTERMRVNGAPVGEAAFARLADRVRAAAERMAAEGGERPTQFEVLTAMAFLYFAEERADYAVVEVGLGGLLDSTNIIVPSAAAITNVALEHADVCGGTLEGVARHKAGIIKAGVPVVTAARGMPLEVIRRTAAEKGAPLYAMGEAFFAAASGAGAGRQAVSLDAPGLGLSDWRYTIAFDAPYQAENSAVAAALLAALARGDARVSMEAARAAFARAAWPGRFERMDIGARNIIVDGAHNPAGMAALRRALDYVFPDEPRVFLLGILHDKAIDEMLDILLRPEDVVVASPPDSARAEGAESLAAAARRRARAAEAVSDRAVALERALRLAEEEGALLCCTGSLYLVGELRARLAEKRGDAYGADDGNARQH